MENAAKINFEANTTITIAELRTKVQQHLYALSEMPASSSSCAKNKIVIAHPKLTLSLTLSQTAGALSVSILESRTGSEPLLDLARVIYWIAADFMVNTVQWPGTETLIPRAAFLDGLDELFALPPAPKTKPTAVTPRRVKPICASTRKPNPAPRGTGISLTNQAMLEQQMRTEYLRTASSDELSSIASETVEGIPLEARLSTWAVSLTVATVSLPVAAPVMVYNVMRGEDMRIASLAMGLAGMFTALDASGAMASVAF